MSVKKRQVKFISFRTIYHQYPLLYTRPAQRYLIFVETLLNYWFDLKSMSKADFLRCGSNIQSTANEFDLSFVDAAHWYMQPSDTLY